MVSPQLHVYLALDPDGHSDCDDDPAAHSHDAQVNANTVETPHLHRATERDTLELSWECVSDVRWNSRSHSSHAT